MDANATAAVTLTAAEWNQTLMVLSDGPYRIVAPIMQKIQQQVMMAEAAAAPPPGANGQPAAADVSH